MEINSDGAVSRTGGKRGSGAVARDHYGAFLVGASHFFPSIGSLEVSEVLA